MQARTTDHAAQFPAPLVFSSQMAAPTREDSINIFMGNLQIIYSKTTGITWDDVGAKSCQVLTAHPVQFIRKHKFNEADGAPTVLQHPCNISEFCL